MEAKFMQLLLDLTCNKKNGFPMPKVCIKKTLSKSTADL